MGKPESGFQKRKKKEKEKNGFNLKEGQLTSLLKRNQKCPLIISQLMLILRPLHLLLFLTVILQAVRLSQKKIMSR